MPLTVLIASALIGLALMVATAAVATALQPARRSSLRNLRRGQLVRVESAPTDERRSLADVAVRLTPPTLRGLLEKQHARAGRPADWTLERLLVLKLLWIPISALVIVLLLLSKPQPLMILLAVVVAVVIYFLPDLLLLSRGQERVQKIQKELADTLDQMMIAVEAGLGFDSAMARSAANGDGALAEELTRTLQDMRMGRSRREAFEDLSERNQVPDLRTFVRAILQADAYGISIGDVLRTQAAEMRLKRRQRAEEKAQQVPVKVLMPLMLCILPVLFIVVMAPAALGMIEAFGGL